MANLYKERCILIFKKGYQQLLYPFILLGLLSLFFLILEVKYPYYFLHDDNRVYWLPALAYNFESLLRGEFPIFNFHQFLGYPWLSNGQTMVLYPFGYVSSLISLLVFGHYFAAIDIFIIFHLLVASFTFFKLLRFIGLDYRSSLFGSITWVLNSFVIYASTGWIFLSVHAVFLPLIIYFTLKLFKEFTNTDVLYLILSRVLLFFVGHPQYFVYSIVFEILTFLLMLLFSSIKHNKFDFIKVLKPYIASYLFTLLLSLPLLLPMFHQMTISELRSSKLDFSNFSSWMYKMDWWLRGFLLPFNSSPEFGFLQILKHMSFIGYIPIIFIILSLIKYLQGQFSGIHKKIISIAVILCSVSFLWMSSKIFNHLIYTIPILNRFRWPFKLEFYFNFYIILIACLGLFIFIRKIRSNSAKNVIFTLLMIAHIFSFVCLYVFNEHRGFQIFSVKPPFDEPLKDITQNGRIVAINDDYSITTQEVSDFIGANFASLWNMYHFAGYEPMISQDNSKASLRLYQQSNYIYVYRSLWKDGRIHKNIDYLRQWGVRWYIANIESILKDQLELSKFYEDQKRAVYEDTQTKPFFYWLKDGSSKGINADINVNTIKLRIDKSSGGDLLINFLYNPFFKATIDDKSVEIEKNNIGQMIITIPQGTHNVILTYIDPFFTIGCWISSITILIMSLVFFISKARFIKECVKI